MKLPHSIAPVVSVNYLLLPLPPPIHLYLLAFLPQLSVPLPSRILPGSGSYKVSHAFIVQNVN